MVGSGNGINTRLPIVASMPQGGSGQAVGDGETTEVDGAGEPVEDGAVIAAAQVVNLDTVVDVGEIAYGVPASAINEKIERREHTVTPFLADIERTRIGSTIHLVADVDGEYRDLLGVRISDDLLFMRYTSSSARGTEVKEGFVWYAWRQRGDRLQVFIPLQPLQEAAKGRSSEAVASFLVDSLPKGLKDSNGIEYDTPPSYRVFVSLDKNAEEETKVVLGRLLVGLDVEPFRVPWNNFFEHSPVDISGVSNFVRGDRKPNIFTDEDLESMQELIERIMEEDMAGWPLHNIPASSDPFWDLANFSGCPRLHSLFWFLGFHLGIDQLVVLENGQWDGIGAMIAARLETKHVVLWKEINEQRKGTARRLPLGYRELHIDEYAAAHFSIWNFPDHSVLETGLNYMGRDLVDGGLLMIQTERELDLWFKADMPGWRLLYHRDMPKDDYVLPSPLLRDFWTRPLSPTRPTRFHFLILQKVGSRP